MLLTFIVLATCHSKTNLCYGVIHISAAETLTATRVSIEPTGRCLDGHLPLGSAHGQNVFLISCVSSLFTCHWHHALVTSEMLATAVGNPPKTFIILIKCTHCNALK